MSELIDCIDGLTAENILKRAAKTANGVPFYINTLGLSGFCEQYQAIYDSYATPPSAAVAEIWNTFVQTLVDGAVWTLADILYIFASHTNTGGEALINWLNPGTYDAINVNCTFTASRGFQGNGLNQYIRCGGWKPTNGINYLQDDAGLYIASLNDVGENKYICGCTDSTHYTAVRARSAANQSNLFINSGLTIKSVANANAIKHYGFMRSSNTQTHFSINKVIINNTAVASTGRPNAEMYAIGYNNNGAPSSFPTNLVPYFMVAANFGQAQIDIFTNAIDTALAAIGAGILP